MGRSSVRAIRLPAPRRAAAGGLVRDASPARRPGSFPHAHQPPTHPLLADPEVRMRRRFASNLVSLTQPYGDLSDPGRSAEELADDRRRIEHILELVPMEALRVAVEESLRDAHEKE